MTLDEQALVTAFRDGSLPASAFHHRDHVRLAWLYVRQHGASAAAAAFTADLQRFAVAKGVPGLFHATITGAYMALVAERRVESAGEVWDDFAAAHPDLLTWKPGILDRYYSAERLWSATARAQFLLPDLPGTVPMPGPG